VNGSEQGGILARESKRCNSSSVQLRSGAACSQQAPTPHLVNRLVGPGVPQLCWAVASDQQQRHAALGSFHNGGKQVGYCGTAGGDHHGWAARGAAIAERPEAKGALVCRAGQSAGGDVKEGSWWAYR